jgi:lambda repressor-like predicted transcriptional regulator
VDDLCLVQLLKAVFVKNLLTKPIEPTKITNMQSNHGETERIIAHIKQFGKPKTIRAELFKRGIELQHITQHLGISRTTLRQVMLDKSVSRRIASYIEQLLEVPPGTIFPYVTQPPRNKKSSSTKPLDKKGEKNEKLSQKPS